MDKTELTELINQTSLHLFDTVKINQERTDTARISLNQADATLFLSIGLHFDAKTKHAFPVIVGTQWLTREQAIQLCQLAIEALNPTILADQGRGGER